MLKPALYLVALVAVALHSSCAFANDFVRLSGQISAAREAMVDLVTNTERRSPEHRQRALDINQAVTLQLAAIRAPLGKQALFAELQETWRAYSRAHLIELAPALNAGKFAEAREIASNVQRRRLLLCHQLLAQLRAE